MARSVPSGACVSTQAAYAPSCVARRRMHAAERQGSMRAVGSQTPDA